MPAGGQLPTFIARVNDFQHVENHEPALGNTHVNSLLECSHRLVATKSPCELLVMNINKSNEETPQQFVVNAHKRARTAEMLFNGRLIDKQELGTETMFCLRIATRTRISSDADDLLFPQYAAQRTSTKQLGLGQLEPLDSPTLKLVNVGPPTTLPRIEAPPHSTVTPAQAQSVVVNDPSANLLAIPGVAEIPLTAAIVGTLVEIRQGLTNLSGDVANLSGHVAKISGELANLSSRITNLDARLTKLDARSRNASALELTDTITAITTGAPLPIARFPATVHQLNALSDKNLKKLLLHYGLPPNPKATRLQRLKKFLGMRPM